MYCSKCGKELKNNVNFCSNCGTPIKNNTTEEIKNNLNGVTNRLQGFLNKAKETCENVYSNIVTKVPILEMDYNKEIEEILLNIGFKWAHSKVNGYRLRLYKYYTDGIYIAKIEIETFPDKLADVYIRLHYYDSTIFGQIVYDILRLRNYIYVRYIGSNKRTKLVDLCSLNDIVYKNGNNKIYCEPVWFEVSINQEIYSKLEKDGYSNCSNRPKSIELKKEEFEIYAYFKSKKELDLNKTFIARPQIVPDKSKCNTNNNWSALDIIEFLKLSQIMRVEILKYTDAFNFVHENISFNDFFSNLDFSFEKIGDFYYERAPDFTRLALPNSEIRIYPKKHCKEEMLEDRKYCKEHEFNKRIKR